VKPLLGALEDPALVSAAAWALGEIGDVRAITPLLTVVSGFCAGDPENPIAIALTKIGDTSRLLEKLRDRSWGVRRMAATVLGKIGSRDAVEPLLVLAANEPDWLVRESCLEALASIDPVWSQSAAAKKQVPSLIEQLFEAEGDRRIAAAALLCEIADPKAVRPLLEALQDDELLVRCHAATALGRTGDVRALQPLLSALDDSDKTMRVCVIRALARVADDHAITAIIKATSDVDRYVRKAAVEALGEIADPKSLGILISMTRDVEWCGGEQICDAATQALQKIDSEWPSREEARKQIPISLLD
jgi:HEAT repeat protein